MDSLGQHVCGCCAAQAQKVDAETALMAHTAAYRVLQALCQGLSDAEAIKAVFAEHGGNPVRPPSGLQHAATWFFALAVGHPPIGSKSNLPVSVLLLPAWLTAG